MHAEKMKIKELVKTENIDAYLAYGSQHTGDVRAEGPQRNARVGLGWGSSNVEESSDGVRGPVPPIAQRVEHSDGPVHTSTRGWPRGRGCHALHEVVWIV